MWNDTNDVTHYRRMSYEDAGRQTNAGRATVEWFRIYVTAQNNNGR